MKTVLNVRPTGSTLWSIPDDLYPIVEMALKQSRSKMPMAKIVDVLKRHYPEQCAGVSSKELKAVPHGLAGPSPSFLNY